MNGLQRPGSSCILSPQNSKCEGRAKWRTVFCLSARNTHDITSPVHDIDLLILLKHGVSGQNVWMMDHGIHKELLPQCGGRPSIRSALVHLRKNSKSQSCIRRGRGCLCCECGEGEYLGLQLLTFRAHFSPVKRSITANTGADVPPICRDGKKRGELHPVLAEFWRASGQASPTNSLFSLGALSGSLLQRSIKIHVVTPN